MMMSITSVKSISKACYKGKIPLRTSIKGKNPQKRFFRGPHKIKLKNFTRIKHCFQRNNARIFKCAGKDNKYLSQCQTVALPHGRAAEKDYYLRLRRMICRIYDRNRKIICMITNPLKISYNIQKNNA